MLIKIDTREQELFTKCQQTIEAVPKFKDIKIMSQTLPLGDIIINDDTNDLGALYSDCDTVPMIKTDSVWDKLPSFLDTSAELKNIYFKVVRYG